MNRSRRLPRVSSIGAGILKDIAFAGTIFFSSANPYTFSRLIGLHGGASQDRTWRYLYRTVYGLQRKNYISLKKQGGTFQAGITKRGKRIVEHLDLAQVQLQTTGHWDGLWRMVLYDIPNTKNANRLAFTARLKTLGFRMIQKSAWVYPYPCEDALEKLKRFYEIEPYVAYLEISNITGAGALQKKFALP